MVALVIMEAQQESADLLLAAVEQAAHLQMETMEFLAVVEVVATTAQVELVVLDSLVELVLLEEPLLERLALMAQEQAVVALIVQVLVALVVTEFLVAVVVRLNRVQLEALEALE